MATAAASWSAAMASGASPGSKSSEMYAASAVQLVAAEDELVAAPDDAAGREALSPRADCPARRPGLNLRANN